MKIACRTPHSCEAKVRGGGTTDEGKGWIVEGKPQGLPSTPLKKPTVLAPAYSCNHEDYYHRRWRA